MENPASGTPADAAVVSPWTVDPALLGLADQGEVADRLTTLEQGRDHHEHHGRDEDHRADHVHLDGDPAELRAQM